MISTCLLLYGSHKHIDKKRASHIDNKVPEPAPFKLHRPATPTISKMQHRSVTPTISKKLHRPATSTISKKLHRPATSTISQPPRIPKSSHCHFEAQHSPHNLSTGVWAYSSLERRPGRLSPVPLCLNCLPQELKVTESLANVCKQFPGQPHLLQAVFLMLSTPSEIKRRRKLREHLSNITLANKSEMFRYIFVVESSSNNATRRFIELEQEEHVDIIQIGIIEQILQLTAKVIKGFEWINHHCNRARFIVKLNHDSYVDIAALSSVISAITPNVGLFGQCIYGDSTTDRTQEIQNALQLEVKLPHTRAPYCYGGGYVISQKAVAKVVRISQVVKPIYLADLYVGMCLSETRFRASNEEFDVLNVTNFMATSRTRTRMCPTCQELQRTVIWKNIPLSYWDCAMRKCYKNVCT